MTKGIDEFVSENRESVKRLDSTFIPVSGENEIKYTFTNNQFNVTTEVKLYTRELTDSLISGHPNEKHGSGRGKGGDNRSGWTQVSISTKQETLVSDGRNSIANSLVGSQADKVSQIAIGDGNTEPTSPSDTSLTEKDNQKRAWSEATTLYNTINAISTFLFSEFGQSVSEFGALSSLDNLFNRITTDTKYISDEKEIKVEIEFEVNGDTSDNSVISNNAEARVADSLINNSSIVSLSQFVFGDGSGSFSKTQLSLDNELFSSAAQRLLSPETVTANTVVFSIEPDSQPLEINEIGVEDENGDIFWQTNVSAFEKNENVEFSVNASFRIR